MTQRPNNKHAYNKCRYDSKNGEMNIPPHPPPPASIGMSPMKIIDICGGFPSNSIRYGPTFQEISSTI